MKKTIACLSDTHRQHTSFTQHLSKGGFLAVHCGDADCYDEKTWSTFAAWAKKVAKNFQHGLIYVPGNHDTFVQENLIDCRLDLEGSTARLLVHEQLTIDGFKVFGSPYLPPIGHPVYNAFTARGDVLETLWEQIPANLDLLVTHGPPYGYRDDGFGDAWLREEVKIKRPRVHVFGHVHGQSGSICTSDTLYLNAAVIGTFSRGPYEPYWLSFDDTKQVHVSPNRQLSVT